jgi:hypothetical protein
MFTIRKLVRQIRTALEEGSQEGVVEHLAVEYARLCNDAVKRLETCAAMLEKGSEYQALQLAETEPPLMDLVAVLSFEQTNAWADLCAQRSLPFPEKFDARLLQALERVYAKGITPNHPLYREYRAAVMSRNDAEAVQVIRSIARLSPGDANAKVELQRLENKLFQLSLQKLKKIIGGRDPVEILTCLEEIERFGGGNARLEEIPEVAEAMELRRVEQQREAILEAGVLMEKLRSRSEAGEWDGLGEILLNVKALLGAHQFSLNPGHAELFDNLKKQEEQRLVAADQARRLEEDLARLSQQVLTIEERLLKREALGAAEAEELLAELNRLWRHLEDRAGSVPAALVQRAKQSAAGLREELNRKRRAAVIRKWRIRIAVGAGTCMLLGIGFFCWILFYYFSNLKKFRAENQLTAAETLALEISRKHAILASQMPLNALLRETEAWIQAERMRSKEIQDLFDEVERAFKGTAKDIDFGVAAKKLSVAGEKAKNLTSELGGVHRKRFKELTVELEALVKEGWGQTLKDAEVEIASLDKIAADKLNSQQSRGVLVAAMEEVEARVKRTESKLDTPVEGLESPEALRDQIMALRQRLDTVREEVASLDNLREERNKAVRLEDFKKALEGIEKSKLQRFGEVVDAARFLPIFPNPEELAGALFVPEDPAVWKTLTPEKRDAGLYPAEVNDSELVRFFELRDDEFLKDISEIEFVDYKDKNEKRMLLLSGELESKSSSNAAFTTKEWSGKFYDPRGQNKNLPAFSTRKILSLKSSVGTKGDGEITGKMLSSASACLVSLELNRMTNEAGSRYERSLLQVFDRIVRHETKNYLLKAYLMQQIGEIFQMRPVDWGGAFCASLKKDLARLSQIGEGVSFTSRDWMQESKHLRYTNALKDFFQQIGNRRYEFEARIHRQLASRAVEAGIRYAGFIDGEGKTHFSGGEKDPKFLWVFMPEKRRLVRMASPQFEAPKEMTVIFSIPLDSGAALREAAAKVLGGDAATPVSLDIPFLATP